MGLPAATGAPFGRVADGEGAAASAGDGAGLAGTCGFAAGAAETAGATPAGATEAAGALAGADTDGGVGDGATVAWHAVSSPVAAMARTLAFLSRRRRVRCIRCPSCQRRPPRARDEKKSDLHRYSLY